MKGREQFLDWIVYELYPRSFYDSDGDGVGDIKGILEKIDHLSELGVNALWLCPCYKSPNRDNGYDISDYRKIMTEFGTLADWKRLKKELEKRQIKLIMDLVANHTSSQHEWFVKGRKSKTHPFHDYYIWADEPLNDWKSVFGGSAWEYNEETDEYYLHSFDKEQPDLNWENLKVRKEMKEIVDYWTELGVDGLRCDVLDFIAKDFQKDKMYNGDKLHDYVRELFNRKETKELFTVGECKFDEKEIGLICGKDRGELTAVFQFDHLHTEGVNKYLPTPFLLDDVRNTLVKWQKFTIKNGLLYTIFTDNHDEPFFLSRIPQAKKYRYEAATAIAAMFFLLRGIPFVYQGQEYGSVNSKYRKIEKFNDVETLRYYEEHKDSVSKKELMERINRASRDNARRPFAWNGKKGKNFGFSTGKCWLALSSEGKKINLETDQKSEKSVFKFYKALFAFRRKNEAVRYGDFSDWTKGDGRFVYVRTWKKQQIAVCCNFESSQQLSEMKRLQKEGFSPVMSNYEGQPFDEDFRPFEAVIFEKILP